MSLVNATRYFANALPFTAPNGQRVVVTLVKATFERNRAGEFVLAAKPSPVRLGEELWDDNSPHGSVRYPSDLSCEKTGTDIVVVGSAISPKPVTRLDLMVRVGAHEAPLVVFGPRVFYKSPRGVAVGPPARFEEVPVVYEHAYGGMAADFGCADERNPAGRGVAHKITDLIDTPAPQIEHPAFPHELATDDHPPAGYGAMRTHWLPRRSFAGTFDDTWRETRMPLLPVDYNPLFENVAHPSLQLSESPPAGTPISILGMSTAGPFQCEIPDLKLVIHALRNGSKETVRPQIDLILIEPERGRVELLARAVWTMGRGKTSLREVRVDTYL
ncbi:MAG: DUF2169 domain-containing protein [Polyangiaceae bacterium]|nr:DUF2169 domain-containing protein [Polyangiaceae bacterium]